MKKIVLFLAAFAMVGSTYALDGKCCKSKKEKCSKEKKEACEKGKGCCKKDKNHKDAKTSNVQTISTEATK